MSWKGCNMIKVFLVEDEVVIRDSIHKIIPWREYGYELAGEAGDGELALPLIRKIKPDVLITDIRMPFMDGLALSELVKKELPATKIVIISGYDDFEYARQAISIGVERYLLKPITRSSFLEVLKDIMKKYEEEKLQRIYFEKFKAELQEYEQHSRRDFFDTLVTGSDNIQAIYQKAEKLQIDIAAQSYNIILFSVNSRKENQIFPDIYTKETAKLQSSLEQLFHEAEDCILFRNQLFSYAVLVKGDKEIQEKTNGCVYRLQEFFNRVSKEIDWFICTGKAVERLSQLPESYKEAMHNFALRYLNKFRLPALEEISRGTEESEAMDIKNIDANVLNPEVIHNFLSHALVNEVNDFVKDYFQMIGEEALKSKIFRQYILLNIHFSTVSFIQKLGFKKEEFKSYIPLICTEGIMSMQKGPEIITEILQKAIQLREVSVRCRYKSVLEVALAFIQDNYTDDMLSLNKVACAANVSANHFSALFSQEMKKTFIEYLTELRMNKAKQLLRCTDMRSGEIALEIGYKDSHYFSFLFRKTQGLTPSDYRNQKGGS